MNLAAFYNDSGLNLYSLATLQLCVLLEVRLSLTTIFEYLTKTNEAMIV